MRNQEMSDVMQKTLNRLNISLEVFRALRVSLLCIVACIFINIFIVKPVTIAGDSMYPTLSDGTIGLTDVFSWHKGDIQRFDIITVHVESENKTLTKRVIGLPKDKVQYKNGVLYINDKKLDETFLDKEYVNTYESETGKNFTADYGPIILEDNEYFLCGDNRIVSRDSRILGPFHSEDIVSKYFYTIFE